MPGFGPHKVPIQMPVPADVAEAVDGLRNICESWQSEYYEGHRLQRTTESDVCFLLSNDTSLFAIYGVGVFTGVIVCVGLFLIARFWQWKKEARRLGLGGEGE